MSPIHYAAQWAAEWHGMRAAERAKAAWQGSGMFEEPQEARDEGYLADRLFARAVRIRRAGRLAA